MCEGVRLHPPNIAPEGLRPDYCGIRPKLASPAHGSQDFQIRTYVLMMWGQKGGRVISLLGIKSPGLTSPLAIDETVAEEFM